MEDAASAIILDSDQTKDLLVTDWQSFLSQSSVGLTANVPKPAEGVQRRDIVVSCNNNLSSLNPLAFSTANNVSDFNIDALDSPDSSSVILGLPKPLPSFTLSLGSALDVLGVRPKGSTSVPGDNGQLPPATGTKPPSLLGFIVNSLTESQTLQLSSDPSAQNAVWLSPGHTYRTDMVLTFELQNSNDAASKAKASISLSSIQAEITSKFGLSASNSTLSLPQIILRRTTYGTMSKAAGTTHWEISTTYRLTFKFPLGVLILWIILEPTGLSFSITTSGSATDLLSIAGLDVTTVSPDVAGVLDHVRPLQLSGGKDGSGVWWRVTLALTWKGVSIYFRYDSVTKTYSGGLILKGFFAVPDDKLLPAYLAGESIDLPDQVTSPPEFYAIGDFLDVPLPSVLPTSIALAEISYNKSSKTLWVAAKLISPPPAPTLQTGAKAVPSPFTWDELDIEITKSATTFAATAATHFTVTSPDGLLAADIGLGVTYDTGNWAVTGYAENLSGALISSFFDPEYSDAMTAVLGDINIVQLQLMYTYEQGQAGEAGSASSFVLLGIVDIGLLELRLFYQYTSSILSGNSAADVLKGDPGTKDKDLPATVPKPQAPQGSPTVTDWRFECDLGASKPGQKVGAVLDSIVGNISSILPTFLTDMDFPTADGTKDRSLISIKVSKTASNSILFAFRVVISSFTLTFAQVGYSQASGKGPKRLLRFSADKIPLIDHIPLLDKLPQPFEQLEYMWLSGQGESQGLLQSEVDAMNQWCLEGVDQLYYKQIVGQAADKAPPSKDPVIIQPGHHFMVINQGKAILDHVFNASPPPQPQRSLILAREVAAAPVAPSSAPAKGSLSFKDGALSITAVTLQYKEQAEGKFLWVTMDATFTLGPITFSLLGFSIGVPLSSIHLNNLAGIFSQIKVDLQGLAFAFDKPPILISAGFRHQILFDGTPQRQEIYMGGIGLSFPPYVFVGLGEYTILNNYKSLFLYAKLDGPLVTLEFATISGIRFGFGYNSMVRSPTLDEITEFPFINDQSVGSAGNNPMAILDKIMNPASGTAWITPKQDAYWFAAGLSITAFDILTVTAVAMLGFRDSGVVVTIYADAIAQMPPKAKDAILIYVEIAMIMEMNFIDGYFMVEASLAPTSFLLVPDCHLYGQFAMIYWFPPNAHSGDWVFSIGGYHSKFTPPEWYPKPKRLGISFSTHGISINGEAYFAITPKCVMGGASLHASLSVGPVTAWLDAAFDAFINFHPLHYEVGFHISVGIDCSIDILFIHIHFSGSIGAYLNIYGPDFGGSAYVDFYLFHFTVDFGASPALPPALSLLEFWELLHKPGPEVTSTNQNETDPSPMQSLLQFNNQDVKTTEVGAAFKFVLEDGNYDVPKKVDPADKSNPSSSGDGKPWNVKGGSFKFRVKVDFAISHAKVAAPDGTAAADIFDQDVPAENNKVCSRPMRVDQAMNSTLTVTIREKTSQAIIGSWRNISFDIKKVPTATYGAYSTDTDPLANKDPSALLDGQNGNVPLAMGLILQAPPPVLAASLIPAFSLADASRLGILDFRVDTVRGTGWQIQKIEPVQSIYIPSKLSTQDAAKANKDQWADMATKWTSLKSQQSLVTDAKDGLLVACTDFLGWNTNRSQAPPTAPAVDTSWQLKGDQPVRLIARMTDKYLALPRVATVAAPAA